MTTFVPTNSHKIEGSSCEEYYAAPVAPSVGLRCLRAIRSAGTITALGRQIGRLSYAERTVSSAIPREYSQQGSLSRVIHCIGPGVSLAPNPHDQYIIHGTRARLQIRRMSCTLASSPLPKQHRYQKRQPRPLGPVWAFRVSASPLLRLRHLPPFE